MDYAKAVARAYADGDKELPKLAAKALADIESDVRKLQLQGRAIMELRSLALRGGTQEPPPQALILREGERGLTDEVKARAKALWTEELTRSGREMRPGEIVRLLKSEGMNLDVGMPPVAIGSVIAKVRRDFRANGQGTLAGVGAHGVE